MDFLGIARGSIRSEALQKLAQLTVEHDPQYLKEISTGIQKDDFAKLISSTPKEYNPKSVMKLSKVPITLKEYEVLIALCDATSCDDFKSDDQVKVLIDKFKAYLLELPNQKFSYNIVRNAVSVSPWTLLGEKLTAGLIHLAYQNKRKYIGDVIEIFHKFIETFFYDFDHQLPNYLTLLGILEGLSKNAKFLSYNASAFKIFHSLDSCIDNFEFLHVVEDYTFNLYENKPAVYSAMLDREYAVNLAPISYLESLSRLMCAIIRGIIGTSDASLLQYILEKVASRYDEDSQVGSGTITENKGIFNIQGLDFSKYHMELIKTLTDLALQKLEFLDRGETCIVYSSFNRLKLGYLAKSHSLQVLSCGMFTDNWDLRTSRRLFKTCIGIKEVMLDPDLGLTVFQFGSLLVFKDVSVGPQLTSAFSSVVANPKLNSKYCLEVSKSVGLSSKVLPQDSVVTTIYSLTNLLFVGYDGYQLQTKKPRSKGNDMYSLNSKNPSMSTFSIKGGAGEFDETDYQKVCENAVTAIIEVSQACNDETVPALAVTILAQKVSRINSSIGPLILRGLSSCAPFLPRREFINLVRLLTRLAAESLEQKNVILLAALQEGLVSLAKKLKGNRRLFPDYLKELLQVIISKGDVQKLEQHRSHTEINEIGDQIAIFLKPLAALLPDVHLGEAPLKLTSTEIVNLFRNIWFNMVVHGYNINSQNAQTYKAELERIAYNTPPLASELSWDRTETSFELNTVLRRGSSNHNVKDHRHYLGDIFEVHRNMSYPKLMFLSATAFVESLRVRSGECSTILKYYSDPSVKTGGADKYIGYIAFKIVKDYIQLINTGANKQFSSDHIAEQLTNMLILCCNPLENMQDSALQCCDLLINKVSSSLCHKRSLFALFDLLTLLFDSLVDADTNQYEPTTEFVARCTGIKLLVSDDYKWRSATLNRFHDKAKYWMKLLLYKCNIDVKSLVQSYVSQNQGITSQFESPVKFGTSFALEMAGGISTNDRELSAISLYDPHQLNTLPNIVSQLSWRNYFVADLVDKIPLRTTEETDVALMAIRDKIYHTKENLESKSNDEIIALIIEIAGLTLCSKVNCGELIRYLVECPFNKFDPQIMNVASAVWLAIMKDRTELSVLLLSELAKKWTESIEFSLGLFSQSLDLNQAEFEKMEYAATDSDQVNRMANIVDATFGPHLQIIKLFSSSFEATLNQSDHLLKMFTQFVEIGLKNLKYASYHPMSRVARFELIRFAFEVLNYHFRLGSRSTGYLTELVLDASLTWFRQRATFPFGRNVLKFKNELSLLRDVARLTSHLNVKADLEMKKKVLLFFLDDEIYKFNVWLNCLDPQETKGIFATEPISTIHITKAYEYDPMLAINLSLRYKIRNLDETLQKLIAKNPLPCLPYPDAIQYLIGINAGTNMPSHHLLFWECLSPIDSITLFLPPFGGNPFILQYTMRSIESHDVNKTFFYVPQIVQSLRFDVKGYVERFILETAKVSQLFAHQIIWNMLANSYKDDNGTIPDDLKPRLDDMQAKMMAEFTDSDLAFYRKEFKFFNEVTSISGKLKPYIKKSKAEKKEKIDEEMALIKVEPGVYLPSNPDGVVIDINRKSGKPLQSHAKAPFMATFRIKKEIVNKFGEASVIEKWQSAIFKVGDDCRQDVLALQLISIFGSIWSTAGLDLYVFPYRVTATAPGCGVIDVLPNATSRDMLGREAVNGLYEYFISKFGGENSIEFQRARNNLVKSLAAYSIISYLLQFKDRHNGNIMYDEQGHCLHIDFGFCFDIVPGGVKFEVAPFKLTKEMVMVLGGSDETQAFKWFEELCIKGYLACRPHMETIVRTVTPMLESGLPCFKDTTIKNLRSRFVPGKSERQASVHFRKLIRKAMESFYTTGYDEFQRITNGIPY
ncbi:STT4 [[Candida] subhashii]|uniref:1-phosphatidylinositol 4-kinase n=1 Tax=[Candida] subhashii TaxID=561895 RepID=A0A8J5QF06_9ASCO|nr:STT4 [[Candida] subhashii]KAG7664604.1 STT4 [[Candida] subhashii]